MNRTEIEKILKSFIKNLHINLDENSISNIITKLSSIQDTNIIIDKFALSLYLKFKNNPGYDSCLEELSKLSDKQRDVKELENTAILNIKTNHAPEDISISENHKLIQETLKIVCDKLNEMGIDYYVVGALAMYLTTNTPLSRYHGDIDFLVEEKDIAKVKKTLENTDYIFSDNRMHNKKRLSPLGNHTQGEHEVIAKHKKNNFHLGFFLFRRENDNSITIREYFTKETNKERIPMVLERHYSRSLSKLEYPDKIVNYNGTYFRAASAESVYLKKYSTKHFKDLLDLNAIESKKNPSIIKEINMCAKPQISISKAKELGQCK